MDPTILQAILAHKKQLEKSGAKVKKLSPEQADAKRRRLWISIVKKEIPKVGRLKCIGISLYWIFQNLQVTEE